MKTAQAPPGVKVFLGMILTWWFPGLGHALLERRHKAWFYFLLVSFTYIFGLWLGDFRDVSYENFGIYLLAQGFYAGATVPALLLTRGLELDSSLVFVDAGVLFTSVAGLLNVCVIVDVYETAYPRTSPPGRS